MHLLAFYGCSDRDLLPHFLLYYRTMGITEFRFALHGDWSEDDLNTLQQQPDCRIESRPCGDFSEQLKRETLTAMTTGLIGKWVVLADADEFIELPCHSLTRTIDCLQVMGALSLPALTMQRHSMDGTLLPLRNKDNLFQRYPMMQFHLAEAMGVNPPIWKSQHPIAKVTENFSVSNGNHSPPNGQVSDVFPIRGIVHHFKWRATLSHSLELPRQADANPHEQSIYHTYLTEHEHKLPLTHANMATRQTLFAEGLLVKPSRQQLALASKTRKAVISQQQVPLASMKEPVSLIESLVNRKKTTPEHLNGWLDKATGKICFISFEVPGPDVNGGIATAVGALAERLALVGHEVHLLYCPYRGAPNLWAGWQQYWLARGVRIHYMPRAVYGSASPGHTTFSNKVADWLRPMNFDLLHCIDADAYGVVAATERANGTASQHCRIVTTVHGPAIWHTLGNGATPSTDDQQSAAALKDLLSLSDVVIYPSQYMKSWIKTNLVDLSFTNKHNMQQHEVVVPNSLAGMGRSFARHEKSRKLQPLTEVVFFGRPEPRKGFGLFCEAMLQLAGDGRKFTITVLGKARPERTADELLATLRCTGNPVVLHDSYSGPEAINYLKTRRALAVVPSLCDNLPYTVFECLEAGIPLVTTTTGGIAELFDNASRSSVVNPHRIDELVNAISAKMKGNVPAASLGFDSTLNDLLLVAIHSELVTAAKKGNTSTPTAATAATATTATKYPPVISGFKPIAPLRLLRRKISNPVARRWRRYATRRLIRKAPEIQYLLTANCSSIPVLMYHSISDSGSEATRQWRVTPAQFKDQLQWLHNNGYKAINENDFNEFLLRGVQPAPRSVMITFDDGYQDFADNAWPLLAQYHQHAWLFLVTRLSGTTSSWDKHLGNDKPLLTDEAIKSLLNTGGVTLGSHSTLHNNLTELNEVELSRDMAESRNDLQTRFGIREAALAYPYGAASISVKTAAVKAGYTRAFGTMPGAVWQGSDWLEIPRLNVDSAWSIKTFAQVIRHVTGNRHIR